MNRSKLIVSAFCIAIGSLAIVGSLAIAESTSTDAGKKPEMKLPPGFTEEDMKACAMAATPGKMHAHLAKGVGTWHGKNTMWMMPGAEPVSSECTSTVTTLMDGRFIRVEISGDMPGMGPFKGLGLYGFDNVSEKFSSAWIDNQGTGMMTGTGKLSSDGKTLTWNYTYNCPLTKKPAVLREVETITSEDTKKLEMFGNDPKSGKEFKMMQIEFTKK